MTSSGLIVAGSGRSGAHDNVMTLAHDIREPREPGSLRPGLAPAQLTTLRNSPVYGVMAPRDCQLIGQLVSHCALIGRFMVLWRPVTSPVLGHACLTPRRSGNNCQGEIREIMGGDQKIIMGS